MTPTRTRTRAYVVFTSLGDDKHSERLLQQEVNTIVLAKPEFMHW